MKKSQMQQTFRYSEIWSHNSLKWDKKESRKGTYKAPCKIDYSKCGIEGSAQKWFDTAYVFVIFSLGTMWQATSQLIIQSWRCKFLVKLQILFLSKDSLIFVLYRQIDTLEEDV